jgi:hypothetical protein
MRGGRANLVEGCEACSCESSYDPPLPSPALSDFLAFPSTPNSHFLGVAVDCGIQLGSASAPASPLLDVIHVKELVQAKLAEAPEKATTLELARKATEVLDKQTDAGAPSTSAVEAPTTSPQAEHLLGGEEKLDSITVSRCSGERKVETQRWCSLPG